MKMQSKIKPDNKKFEELVLLIAERSEGDPCFGATKLNKLLFYVDFLSYLELRKPISGVEYQRLQFGPAPRRMLPVREKMVKNNHIAIGTAKSYGSPKERIHALKSANLDMFSVHEIDLINRVIQRFWNFNATEISEQSHRLLLWQHTPQGETIPYEMALIGSRKLTDQEISWGNSLKSKASAWLASNAL